MNINIGKDVKELSVQDITDLVEDKSDVKQGLNISKTRLPTKKGTKWESKDSVNQDFETNDSLSASELMAKRAKKIEQYKAIMAHSARTIVSDPQSVSCYNRLLIFLADNNPLTAITVRRYAAVCLLDVFTQIIPNYKINENAIIKKKMTTTEKDEQVILQFYLRYIKYLQKILSESVKMKPNSAINSLDNTVVKCLCTLVEKHPRFNFKDDLLVCLIRYLNYERASSHLVFATIKKLFEKDKQGDESLKIVKHLYKFIIKKKVDVAPALLQIFLHLNLEHLENKEEVLSLKARKKNLDSKELTLKKLQKKKKQFLSRKQKRENKKHSIIQNKINELNEQIIEGNLAIRHSEILEHVLGIYFLILKRKPKVETISSVFEGLARVAHLINIDFFIDLMKVLDSYFEDGRLGTLNLLYCIKTVFTILLCQQEALTIDPYRFYVRFYSILPTFAFESDQKILFVVLDIYKQLFKGKKINKISTSRIVAFLRRLSLINIHTKMPHHSLTTIENISSFINDSTDCILSKNDAKQYNIEINDPDLSNSEFSCIWESYLLQKSYHPKVSQEARNLLLGKSITKSYTDLYSKFDSNELFFDPPIAHPDTKMKLASKPCDED